jgi:ribosome maturation protein Sdo1
VTAVPHHETPFDNIDSALEYVSFLVEACREAEKQVAEEIARMSEPQLERKKMALQLVSYKLDRLTSHVGSSERLLKDLRRLRRLILEERHLAAKSAIA